MNPHVFFILAYPALRDHQYNCELFEQQGFHNEYFRLQK